MEANNSSATSPIVGREENVHPIAGLFERMRGIALQNPLRPHMVTADNIANYTVLLPFSPQWNIHVTVLCLLAKSGEFGWRIEAVIVNALTNKPLSMTLATKRQQDALHRAVEFAIGENETYLRVGNKRFGPKSYIFECHLFYEDEQKIPKQIRNELLADLMAEMEALAQSELENENKRV